MGLTIANQMSVYLTFNGIEFLVGTDPSTFICIRDNVKQLVPTLEIRTLDIADMFGANPVSDGSNVQVYIGDGSSNITNLYKFNAFGSPHKQPTNSGYLYNIHCMSSFSPMIRQSVNASITGPSVEVAKETANKFGLSLVSNIESSNDNMTWRPGRQSWSSFLKYVAQHAYTRDGGFVSTATDAANNLYFMDVPLQLSKTDIKAVLYQGNQTYDNVSNAPTIFCLQYKVINRAGFLNNSDGFGLRTNQMNASTGAIDKYSKVTAQTSNNSLDISATLYNKINPVAKISLPSINTGNTHDNYINARHQNARLSATYSQNVYVLINQMSNLNLYDKVYFSAINATGQDSSSAGFYLVTGKAAFVSGTKYFEKIELTNSGPATGTGVL